MIWRKEKRVSRLLNDNTHLLLMGPGGEEQKQNKRDDKWPVAGARVALSCLALFHKHFCLWVQMDSVAVESK